MSSQPFKTVAQSSERGRVVINLPFDPTALWGKQKRHYVKGTINGTPFSGWLDVRDEQYSLPLDKELRDRAGIMPGDPVDVVMEADAPEAVEVPDDLIEALRYEPEARKFFEGLSTFYQNAYVEWITATGDTLRREARVTETINALKARKQQR